MHGAGLSQTNREGSAFSRRPPAPGGATSDVWFPVLQGHVIDIDRNPVSGATVTADDDEIFAVTNADGDFRLTGPLARDGQASGEDHRGSGARDRTPGGRDRRGRPHLLVATRSDRPRGRAGKASRLPGAAHTAPDVLGTMVLAGATTTIMALAGLPANLVENTGHQVFSRVPGALSATWPTSETS